MAVPTCSILTSSGIKGQERSLSLVQLRYFLFSNSTKFHLIPSSSHSTEKHSQLLLACIGCQTADCLDYTGLFCIPAGTSHTKCFLWDQGSLLGSTRCCLEVGNPKTTGSPPYAPLKTFSLEPLKVQTYSKSATQATKTHGELLLTLAQPFTAKGSCLLSFVQVLEIKATPKLLAAWEIFQFHFYY